MPQSHDEMKLSELSEQTGVPPRTIRLYITRGLLPGPLTRGRGAVYSRSHAERLEEIVRLQRQGLTLAEISAELEGESGADVLARPVSVLLYHLADDVTVQIRSDAAPWRRRIILRALDRAARELQHQKGATNDDRG